MTAIARSVTDRDAVSTTSSPLALLSVKGVAQLLGISERWVHERTRLGEIPCYRFGKTLRFDPEEIRRWITQYHHRETESTERRRP